MTTEYVRLTEADQVSIACLCHEALCPLHNEASDGYIEHNVSDLLEVVERLKGEWVEEARAEVLREVAALCTPNMWSGRAPFERWIHDQIASRFRPASPSEGGE